MKKFTIPFLHLFGLFVASPLCAGLVAHFPLDDNGDAAIGGFSAAIDNGAGYGEPGANANTGTSAQFDGFSVLQVDWEEALNPESFTLMAWARSNGGAGGFQSVVTSSHDLNPDSEGYVIYDAKVHYYRVSREQ